MGGKVHACEICAVFQLGARIQGGGDSAGVSYAKALEDPVDVCLLRDKNHGGGVLELQA